MDSAKAIIDAIEAAFAGVPRGQITLHEAEVMDAYGTEAERRDARARDTEDDWRDVPDASIEECPTALCYVDPPSWRFYLPAYMRHGLRHLAAPRSAVDHAIYALCVSDDAKLAAYALERFRTLSPEQSRVVRLFLEFAAAHDELCDAFAAREALRKHWSRIDP